MIKEFVTLLQLSCHLIFTFGLFTIMTISAPMVAEASSEVHLKSLLTLHIAENSTLSYQRLIMYADKDGIILTVWGITPMKKNFIFGMLGMSFTYILLFYGLNPVTFN
ncbi:hypothetical protein CDAR_253241 [Caerostris darwini]|uniref:Uncharacterized protein n=1 Tax=Caerostris darwini TaxID=1538125 RepID=A0AAV4Q692_9ARAC|nr:hypothetical protein CDAR_253241 [Caerostris darwini]